MMYYSYINDKEENLKSLKNKNSHKETRITMLAESSEIIQETWQWIIIFQVVKEKKNNPQSKILYWKKTPFKNKNKIMAFLETQKLKKFDNMHCKKEKWYQIEIFIYTRKSP